MFPLKVVQQVPGVEVGGPAVLAGSPRALTSSSQPRPRADVDHLRSTLLCGQFASEVPQYVPAVGIAAILRWDAPLGWRLGRRLRNRFRRGGRGCRRPNWWHAWWLRQVQHPPHGVRAAGRTYRKPRRLLVPSAALVEGRAPVSAPNSPGGLTTHPVPGACVPTSTHLDTGAVVSVCGKWRLRSGGALSPSGPLPPPSAMEAPEVLWQWRGVMDGGFSVASPGHLVNLHSQCMLQGAHRMAPLVPIPSARRLSAGGPMDGATGARPLCLPRHRSSHWPNGWRR